MRRTNSVLSSSPSSNWFSSSSFDPYRAAKELLGLPLSQTSPTPKEIRAAYFTAAKRCHPDLQPPHSNRDLVELFHQITRAYELLQKGNTNDWTDVGITDDEEATFRVACQEQLGLTAATVEESKQNPMFREWLQGKTDAAYFWQNFLANHGGLAPMLRPKPQLTASSSARTLRRRKR
ncbi:hypothetical protein FisN_9Lh341 [Fistulifera solaris]|uniref:J domain-containing protein n=1 Tax=Fistulifera solaris TaxID=1519565 RepID=A0A1Z5KL75_FISSO|nr:hypothetical protein FisN_9Lh341 [Fistulifera solaris]|eukprot:GAX27026.1 hypothetical protein FisN_9Lh341 [Fistulifera solaris]